MAREPEPLFSEEQRFTQARLRILTAIPPVAMLLLAIWQVGLGHKWGKQPMSNSSLVFWTIFVWAIYFRLITVKLITELRPGELRVAMRGLWRSSRIQLSGVRSAKVVTFNPILDWGGYGVRSNKRGRAFIASGDQGVELEMADGGIVLVGSARAPELARALDRQLA